MFISQEEKEKVGKVVKCGFCGEEFTVKKDTKGMFCSRKCVDNAKRRYITKTCSICSKIFTVPYYRRSLKYCSKECSIVASSRAKIGRKRTDELKQKISETQKVIWDKRRKGEMALRSSAVWHTEEWKKEQSERLKLLYEEGKINCSWKKISEKDEETIIEYYLDFCSTSKIAEMFNVSKTAILRCLHKNHVSIRPAKGEFHPFWKGGKHRDGNKNYGSFWHQKKSEVLKRDNYECQLCGNKLRLEVHHIIPIRFFSIEEKDSKGNDINNLITLCLSCHRAEHYILKLNELKSVA